MKVGAQDPVFLGSWVGFGEAVALRVGKVDSLRRQIRRMVFVAPAGFSDRVTGSSYRPTVSGAGPSSRLLGGRWDMVPRMQCRSVLALVVLATVLVASCSILVDGVRGSGRLIEWSEPVAGFTRVELSHGFQAEIRQGPDFSVAVRIDDNAVDYVVVRVSDDLLEVGLEPGRSYSVTNEVAITMPALAAVGASGGSRVTVTGFSSESALAVGLSGGSGLQGELTSGDAVVDMSGGSRIELVGSAGDLEVMASGGSVAELARLSAGNVVVGVSGGSTAAVAPSGRLDADASGGSRVLYSGSPTLGSITTSGGSEVRQR
jgi:hypothetical protein